jgi:hypothetical protein
MITHILSQTCLIYQTAINKHGEQEIESSESYLCKFREITEVSTYSNREDVRADALLWLEGDTPVDRGTLISVDNVFYRVERLTKARRLTGETVEFIKCLLEKHIQSKNKNK